MDLILKCFAARGGLLLAVLLLGGCVMTKPDSTPNLQDKLDALYSDDRRAWREEMRRLLLEGRSDIPEKHLALSMETFNRGGDRELLMESVWRYLDQRRGSGTRLRTDSDRRLLHTYAETALRSHDAEQRERLDALCLTLTAEPVCADN